MNPFREGAFYLIVLALLFFPLSAYSQHLMSVIKNQNNLSAFAKALETTGLDQQLSGEGPYTVFAPTNTSFRKEISGKNISSSGMKNMLLNHIMTGYATKRNIQLMSKISTLGNATLVVKTDKDGVKINNIRVIEMNKKAQNGVVHIMDGVLK